MAEFEVPQPILNTPFDAPALHWYIEPGVPPEQRPGRRPAGYFFRDPAASNDAGEHAARGVWQELPLVNLIRERLDEWRALALRGEGGVTRTTCDLLNYWRRDGRQHRLFFAQREAAETIIFLNEARADFLQGLDIPLDEPSDTQRAAGAAAFRRYACKMATGSGKTTVMAMLIAWSLLNKAANKSDARFSEAVLVVCPNVTIRSRLQELNPTHGEASLYRTRDLVPPHLMPDLCKGRVLITNWHVFELQSPQQTTSARVQKTGVEVRTTETITIADKTTTARNRRYLSRDDYARQVAAGMLTVLEEERDAQGELVKVRVETVRYVESDTGWLARVLDRDLGGKKNLLVFNDEAHHAYRIRRADNGDEDGDEDAELDAELEQEATIWIDGLDRLHRLRGINQCIDLSATPYYLGRVGQDTNKIFPWTVSDFGLTDAIEAGLVKIPQLAVRDTTGAEVPGYFNIWQWLLPKLTAAERGGKKGSPKPEAILKWAHTPLSMLGGLWEEMRAAWAAQRNDPRPPVFIIVCKNTKIARVIFEWLGEDVCPSGIPPCGIAGFRNSAENVVTIRVDSKVVSETDTGEAKSDEGRWMRATLDTVGQLDWPRDSQGRALYPDGFEELAGKLDRPLHPPGRDVRCIVSVGMLTEGWDCRTVTHIIGLRPFMSQLLCEQVVGRALRRTDYGSYDEHGRLTEEVAKVLGVPFEVIPFKENKGAAPQAQPKRFHVCAVPGKAAYELRYPRVQGYMQGIRNAVSVDWDAVPNMVIDPTKIPPEVQVKAALPTNQGRPSLTGPGRIEDVTLNPYRKGRRLQELAFELARDLTREYKQQSTCQIPAHALFPQLLAIAKRYLESKIFPVRPCDKVDTFLSPYYGWAIEILRGAIRPDTARGETPELPVYEANRGCGTTAEVDFWTSRDVREVRKSHLNYVVADTRVWEQSAAYILDTHAKVDAFVKNAGLGFAIPYMYNGQMHDYIPDFIVRLAPADGRHVILETKGFDELVETKKAAALRWVSAVNAGGRYGQWRYALARSVDDVRKILDES
jgi:type III restriction enzyme